MKSLGAVVGNANVPTPPTTRINGNDGERENPSGNPIPGELLIAKHISLEKHKRD